MEIEGLARVACVSGIAWGAVVGGIAGGRGEFNDTLLLVSAACGVGVAILGVVLTAGGGPLAGVGQAVARLAAVVLSLLFLLGFLLALTLPLQLLGRLAFMEAYQQRFPIASDWLFEQVITVAGLAVITVLARRRLGGILLGGFVAALLFGIPLIAGVSILAIVGLPAMFVVEGWLWIVGEWPSSWPGVVFGAVLGAGVGMAHGLVVSVLVSALVELEW
jgi:hypothetical protein